MGNQGRMGLIVDREQLCAALGVSDSTITSWEQKGMPAVRRGRGRGMKSLYELDAVRAWCKETGYGHTIQALVASFNRREPEASASRPVQTSAPPAAPAIAVEDQEALRAQPAYEVALVSLPGALGAEGVAPEIVDRILAALFDAMRKELLARGEPARFIARELDGLRTMVSEERAAPGTWTK